MTVELEVTFYDSDLTEEGELSVTINLASDDPKVRQRFATMAREMEANAHALLALLTDEPSPFDDIDGVHGVHGSTGGSNG